MSTTLAPPPQRPLTPESPVTGPRGDEPGAAGGPGRPSEPRRRWVVPALVALLSVTAGAYLWNLSSSGYANSFYAAAVQAGTKSWKAFFFGSLDSSNFITVDKSPGSLWVMELSGRLFGFNSWSMLVPQVAEGVAAVALVFAAVRRWFGAPAGLLAGAVLACTPVAALMFRFNNPDAFMVLLLTAAAYTLTRAVEKAGTRWLVATGALLGFAFLAKMLQAFTVVPAFAGVYLLAAPTGLRRRLSQLLAGCAAMVLAAGWWVATVALWPVGSRPMIDGSPDNSILNLIFGYNGLERLSGGNGPGGTFSGATGLLRLFNDLMGGQASWLLPAALVTLVVGVVWRGRAPRTDRTRAALLLWGGWLVVTGLVFSLSSGVIHTYYTVALAPAIAALVGIGAAVCWQHRAALVARLVGAATIVVTAVWAAELLWRTPSYLPWLAPCVLGAGSAAALLLAAAPALARARAAAAGAAVCLGLVAALGGPLAYTATTLRTAHTGSIPSAGPTVASAIGGLGAGGVGAGGPGGTRVPGGAGGVPAGSPGAGSSGSAAAGRRLPSGVSGQSGPGSQGRSVAGGAPGAQGRGGTGGSPGSGAPGGATVDAALTRALRSDASHYRWVAATFGSSNAATLELASDEPVMAIGGFNGEGGNISLGTFEAYVANGDIHYFIASGGGGGGPGGGRNSDAAITSWVESHFHSTTVGGRTLYDLDSPVR